MKKLMLILVVLLFVASSASAAIERLYNSGAWQTGTDVSSGTYYNSLAADATNDYFMYASKAGGGVDRVYHNGSAWTTESDIVSGSYNALTADGVDDYFFYGANAGGGVDRIWHNGSSYSTESIASGTYTSLAADGVDNYFMSGTKAGGGIDRIYLNNSGVWTTETDIVSGTYTSITTDAVNDYFFYGAKAGGGVDRIWWTGSTYATESIASGTYTSLAADGVDDYFLYGAKADGGVDRLYYNSSVWTMEADIVAGTYGALTADCTNDYFFYGTEGPVPVKPAKKVVEYYLDEVSGSTAADTSGNGNDGTVVNAPGDDSQWVAGADGGALYLDGADYLDTDVPVTGDNSYTIACYVSGLNTLDTTNTVYGEFKVGAQSLFAMRCDAAGKLNVYLQDDSGTVAVNLTSVKTVFDVNDVDSWHHIALTNAAGNVKLYVDGELDNTATYNPGAFSFTVPDKAYIGARADWSSGTVMDYYTSGIIDMFTVFDEAVTSDVVEDLQIVDLPAKLMVKYFLNEVTGAVAADSSGNGNDGTVINVIDPNEPDGSQWVTGAYGGGLYLDGTYYLDTGVPVTGDSSWAIGCYVSAPSTHGITNTVYSEANVGVKTLFNMRCSNGKLNVWLQDDSGANAINLTSIDTVFDNSWHHVAVVNNFGNVSLYVDGELDNTAAYDPEAFTFTAADIAYVGARAYWSSGAVLDYYTGKIDEFTAYEKATSIEDLYGLVGDLDREGDVDIDDLQLFVPQWLDNNIVGQYSDTTLDDIESYTTDTVPPISANNLRWYWQPFIEETGTSTISLNTTNAKSGSQSLKWDYDNSVDPNNRWSEILYVPDSPIDLTQHNALNISLYRYTGNEEQGNIYVKFLNGGLTNNEVAMVIAGELGGNVEPAEEWVDYTLVFDNGKGTGPGVVFDNGYTNLSQLTNVRAIMIGTVRGASIGGQGSIDIDDLGLAYVPYCSADILGDFDDDCDVDLFDFVKLAENWLVTNY